MLAGSSAPWWEDTSCVWVLSSLLLSAAGPGTPGEKQSPKEAILGVLVYVFTNWEPKHQILRTRGREEIAVSRKIHNPKENDIRILAGCHSRRNSLEAVCR